MNFNKFFLLTLILALSSSLLFLACSEKKDKVVIQTSDESETLNKSELTTPPPPPEEGEEVVEYDMAPKPVGGYEAIQKHLIYPKIARKAGIQGRVLIMAQIDNQGDVISTKVKESLGPNGCDEAAITAIKSVKWKPAMKDNKPVEFCWVPVHIEFKLR